MEITDRMIAIAKKIGAKYTLKGRVVAYDEVFGDTGLLPGLVKRADQLASLCFGYGLGANFEDLETSVLGSKVSFDEFTPEMLRLMCITDVLFELIKASPTKSEVSLDELMYD